MIKQNCNTSEARAEQAASKPYRSIKLGLDIHAETIVVVRILDNSTPQPAQSFSWAKFRVWCQTQVTLAQAVHSCYEAGPFGYGLHRELAALGVQNLVVQPVCLDERHTGVKHDKLDALELALRLERYVAGNTRALATVRVPTPEQEQKRIESRQREQLRRETHRIGAQGRSLLLSQGFREKRSWWQERRWGELQSCLPTWLRTRLETCRRLLIMLTSELKTATEALRLAAPKVRPKGLGDLTLEVIEREVESWDRFTNRRQVGSFTGLCGGLHASGNHCQLRSITKHGNTRLRAALIELAWRLLIWQPNCKLVQKWRFILGDPKARKASRKKAIVAIARQMAVDLWRWRTGRVQPEDLGWVMLDA